MPPDEALELGWTGPNLRGSGIAADLRRDNPYLVYNELDFDVITRSECDVLARYIVRFEEIKQSAKIIRQCLDKLPKGDYSARDAKRVIPKKGEIYSSMEELINDFMLVNFGQAAPSAKSITASNLERGVGMVSRLQWHRVPVAQQDPRAKFRESARAFALLEGCMISDIVAIIGSIDPIMGEADK